MIVMNRRKFVQRFALVTAGGAVVGSLTGCPWTTGQTVNEINVILDQAANILVVIEPNAPWLKPFQNAIVALKSAEQQWQGGGSVQILISALNTVEEVLAVVPETASYAPLIAVLVGGIEAVLAALPQAQASAAARMAKPNPYRGKVTMTASAASFKKAWNDACAANPQLAGAKLR